MELYSKQTRRVIAAAYSDRLEELGKQASDSQFGPRNRAKRVKQTDDSPSSPETNLDPLLLDYLNGASFGSPAKSVVGQNSVMPLNADWAPPPRRRLNGQKRGPTGPRQRTQRGNHSNTRQDTRKPLPSWL